MYANTPRPVNRSAPRHLSITCQKGLFGHHSKRNGGVRARRAGDKGALQFRAVPSKLGYRYYVDHLLDPLSVTKNDLIVIQNSLGTEYQKIDEIVSHSADLLSNLTSYTAFTLKPEQKDARLSGFRLVPLGNQKVIAILVTDTGDVESQSFTLPRGIDTEAMEAVIRLINDQLTGLTLPEVVKRLVTDIPLQVTRHLHQPRAS